MREGRAVRARAQRETGWNYTLNPAGFKLISATSRDASCPRHRSDKLLRDLRWERRLNSCSSTLTSRLLGRASSLPSSPFTSEMARRLCPRGSLNVTRSFEPCIPAPQEHQAQAHSQSPTSALDAGCQACLPVMPAKGWLGHLPAQPAWGSFPIHGI